MSETRERIAAIAEFGELPMSQYIQKGTAEGRQAAILGMLTIQAHLLCDILNALNKNEIASERVKPA